LSTIGTIASRRMNFSRRSVLEQCTTSGGELGLTPDGCLYGHNCSGDKAVRAFTHTVFDEVEALVRLGNALRNRVGNIRSMRLTEIKPMPLVVRRWYVGETKRFRRDRAALGARANRLGSQVFRPANCLN